MNWYVECLNGSVLIGTSIKNDDLITMEDIFTIIHSVSKLDDI